MHKDSLPPKEEPATLACMLCLWVLLILVGLVDAWLVTSINLSAFASTAVHGTLLALVGANNWALQRDLDKRNSPIDAMLNTEKAQIELVTRLSITNMKLQKKNRALLDDMETLKRSYTNTCKDKWHLIEDSASFHSHHRPI